MRARNASLSGERHGGLACALGPAIKGFKVLVAGAPEARPAERRRTPRFPEELLGRGRFAEGGSSDQEGDRPGAVDRDRARDALRTDAILMTC
jgi:hypothetical protein